MALVQYPSVADRYFQRYYKANVAKKQGEDQCVLAHSNGICVITIAKSHRIFTEGKTVTKVDFQISSKCNRLDTKASGKSKRGAQQVTELSPVCHVTCDDGSTFCLVSCVAGGLLEVNERLLASPSLLTAKRESDGFVAIVQPKKFHFKDQISRLLKPDHYQKKLEYRKQWQERQSDSSSREKQTDSTAPEQDSQSNAAARGEKADIELPCKVTLDASREHEKLQEREETLELEAADGEPAAKVPRLSPSESKTT